MPLKLDIRHLEVLLAVRDQASLTLAASRLGVTQSALSHRIREAERRIDAQLCERQNRQLRLTPLGELMAARAETIIGDLYKLEREVELNRLGIWHLLKVGSRAYSCYRWMPEFLRYFEKIEPKIGVEFVDDAASKPFEALQSGLVDVSIQSGTAEARGVRRVQLFRDQLVAILPPDHPKARAKYLTPGDFNGEVYVTYSSSPERGHEWDQLFIHHEEFQPKKFLTAGLTEAVIELVHSGFGLSIIAGWAVRQYAASGYVVALPVTANGLYLDWYAAHYGAGGEASPASRFTQVLAKWCRSNSKIIGYHALTPSRRRRK